MESALAGETVLLETPSVMEPEVLVEVAEPAPEPPSGPERSVVSFLESAAIKAAAWTIVSYGAAMGLRVVNSLVLTRMLAPTAFGEMILVSTLITGITLLSDIGLGPSVIQSERGDDVRFLNTAWTLQAGRGIALWLIAMVIAAPAAHWYRDPSLTRVLAVLALSCVIGGFNSTGFLTLSRHLGVRRLFAIDFSTQIIALVVTVAWAYRWPSVWALVAGNLVSGIYRLILSHIPAVTPGIRNRWSLDRKSLTEIVHFGKWIVLGTAFFFFASQADRLLLGRMVSLTTLGIYGIAFQISDVPRSIINAFSQRVGFPFVAKLMHLPQADFRGRFLRYRGFALSGGAVLLAAMVVWGDLLILKFYPARYHEGSWMIPVLAVGLWHTLLYTTTQPVLFSLGKSTYNAVGNALYCAAMLIGIPLGFKFFGMPGAVVAVAAGDFPLYVVTQFGAQREGVRPLRQDLLLTLLFLALLAVGFGLRRYA
ncbi:Membrane protein involved in the export of O-antigen and teichoic acid [Bryocella elongata]|uniref:Membrane protein involved in the export of O-antigen and teichoic acid n=1 Tax=Bryocella elongata TaxID=863522 RepID=A0A1H6AWP6_9BACT|nr:oligosaccharide flippase family protein [Bryocella elongata]SEG52670.1 Membrane protein involved in the export of O-antigen and teichoic acid [Bryocella elongata]